MSEVLLQVKLASPESGKHLLEAEELLQTHRLLEADMAVQAEKIRDISAAALRFADAEGKCARTSLHPWGGQGKGHCTDKRPPCSLPRLSSL